MSFELFIVRACQATLLLIVLVMPGGAQTQRRPASQRPTATRPRPQVTFADEIKRCLTRPADAVLTAQKNASGLYSGQVDSTGVTYANDDCGYFMVDVILPEGFKITGHLTLNKIRIYGQFSNMTSFTENNCKQASFRTIIYQSSSRGAEGFVERHRSDHEGNWPRDSGAFQICYFGGQNSLEVNLPEGGLSNTRTYRVLVSPKVNGQPRPAMVGWKAVDVVP